MAMAVKSSYSGGIGPAESWTGWEWEWQEEDDSVKDEPEPVVVAVEGTPAASFFFSLEPPPSPSPVAPAAAAAATKSTSTSLKLGRSSQESSSPPPSKKQRALSPPVTTLVPRCQVENCKADLSGCKDYHKRHKVCEMHSKAPKAIANGIEQRFCQQCSRFHLLKEFDEGKRSCRRRLAGHNERRRKPHPEPHSFFQLSNAGFLHREISTSTLTGVGSPFYSLLPSPQEDIKPSSLLHAHRGSFLEFNTLDSSYTSANSFSFKSRNDNIPTFQIQNPKTPMTILKPASGLNLGGHEQHRYLDHESTTSSLGPLGQGLSLSPSTGRVQVQQVLEQQQQHQQQSSYNNSSSNSSAMDSGRALSLLSSPSWASPRPPAQQQHHDSTTLEHLVASSTSSSHESSTNSNSYASPHSFAAAGGLNFNGLTATGSSGTLPHINNINSNNNSMSSTLGGYDTSSMLALLQGGGLGLGTSPLTTMDLISNGAYHGTYNSGGSSFSSLRAFESSRFSHQQLL